MVDALASKIDLAPGEFIAYRCPKCEFITLDRSEATCEGCGQKRALPAHETAAEHRLCVTCGYMLPKCKCSGQKPTRKYLAVPIPRCTGPHDLQLTDAYGDDAKHCTVCGIAEYQLPVKTPAPLVGDWTESSDPCDWATAFSEMARDHGHVMDARVMVTWFQAAMLRSRQCAETEARATYPLDKVGWICSVCRGWNPTGEQFCIHSHLPLKQRPAESAHEAVTAPRNLMRYKVQQDQGQYCLKGCPDGDLVDYSAYEALLRRLPDKTEGSPR